MTRVYVFWKGTKWYWKKWNVKGKVKPHFTRSKSECAIFEHRDFATMWMAANFRHLKELGITIDQTHLETQK